jgi:hypothetical protein
MLDHVNPEHHLRSMIGYHLAWENSLVGMVMVQGKQREVVNIGLGIKQVAVEPCDATVSAYEESLSHKVRGTRWAECSSVCWTRCTSWPCVSSASSIVGWGELVDELARGSVVVLVRRTLKIGICDIGRRSVGGKRGEDWCVRDNTPVILASDCSEEWP